MYQVIARKYRPQTFHDVVNQEHVKTTLENAIAQERVALEKGIPIADGNWEQLCTAAVRVGVSCL